MGQYCKLVMVTEANNNKFYIMEEKNGLIHIEYGRVDSSSTKLTKPVSQWGSIYREKTKKGYKDVTHLVTEKVVEEDENNDVDEVLAKLDEAKVNAFLDLMQKYTDGLVKNTYSVTYKSVTVEQVKKAQDILNEFDDINKNDEKAVNEKLIELYTVIPRRMGRVSDHLLPKLDLDKALEKEQDNIDAMSSKVQMYEQEKENSKQNKDKKEKPKQTMLDVLGLSKMVEIKSNPDLKYLIDQIGGSRRVEGIFELSKPEEDKVFDNWMGKQQNLQTRILIHGTRCSSVLSILKQGLKIRPSGNFQFSGKVYGNGNYFSEVVQKSLNYTGYDNDKILLVYEVHTGNPFIYDGWYRGNSFTLDYKNLQQRGFDSTYVKAGNGLLNSEIIAYKEEQCRIKYIIWLK
jgi:poly [ADP-ribose] polymerase